MRYPSKRPPPIAKKPQDPIPTGHTLGQTIAQPSAVEQVNRKFFVVNLANAGATLSRIIDEGVRRRPIPLDEQEVTIIYRAHLADVKQTYAKAVDTFREQQVERLMADLLRMRMGEPVMTKDGVQMSFRRSVDSEPVRLYRYDNAGIAKTELLLAQITGTLAPKRIDLDVNHDVTDALAKVIAGYDPKQREQLEEEQRRLEADAQQFRVIQGGKS